jgi:hypothetical protein
VSEPLLTPGTPCYLINLVDMEAFNGRVIEVITGPLPDEMAVVLDRR